MKISVSFLKNKTDVRDTLEKLDETTADFIHVDIMDGKFTSEKTMDEYEFLDCLKGIKKPLDIHLMVENPTNYIEVLKELNPRFITVHAEIPDYKKYIDLIHSYNIGAGIAINPKTRVMNVECLDNVEYVLVMSVNPGLGGQKLIPETIEKLDILQKLKHEKNYNYLVSIDGGVNLESRVFLDSADVLVSGSYICMSDNFQEKIDSLK